MSFVKKAVKKVIKTVKKIVRSKVFKIVAIAALTLFTAGVAAGGFAAFSGVSSIGGFFTAVGQTIATGASAIAGGLGFKGASASLAQYGGAAAEAAGLSALSPVTVTAGKIGPAYLGGSVSAVTNAAATNAAGSGFLASVKGFLGAKVVGDATIGELALKGISTGIAATLKSKQNEKAYANSFVAGDVARGGGSEAPPPIDYEFGTPPAPAPIEDSQVSGGVAEAEPTVAARLAQSGQAGPTPANRIQALIAQRGPINAPGYSGVAPQGGLIPQMQTDTGPQFADGGLVLQGPTTPAVEGRRFNQQATQLQYATRGLV